MYSRPQPSQSYPRHYGNAYPPQQPSYPPQQPSYPPQQSYAPQYPSQQPGAYPPHGQYPQGYPSNQSAPQRGSGPVPYGGGPSPPRGAYGPSGPQGPSAMPMARGSLPYGARPVAPPLISTYEKQAQKWKKGFAVAPGASNFTSGTSFRQSDIEAPLIAELCSSAGSSYPPRDVLQKFLRHLPSLDHHYVCELLDDKLDDRVWQVQGKALSVLDALFKSQEGEFYKNYYYSKLYVLEALCTSKKELLRARAEKVFNVIKNHTPPAPPSPEAAPQMDQYDTPAPTPAQAIPAPEINLLGSPVLMAQEEPIDAPPSSAFGFLNGGPSSPAAPPSPVPAASVPAEQAPVSAFSFLSSQPASQPSEQPQSVTTPMSAVSPVPAAPVVDIFSSLPPPTPVVGLVVPVEEPAPAPPVEEEPKVHDPIHDAFEGLNLDDDDEDETTSGLNSDNTLEGFSTASMELSSPVIKIDPSSPVREIILEVDVPAGPMGLMLDRSIPQMAIVQGFLRMPTGERGYLELHPVLCPGCALVSINSVNVEDKDLEEVGTILGSLMNQYKVLRFKKLMRAGHTVNPADPDVVYTPPPPEKVEAPPAEPKEEPVEDDGSEFIDRLNEYKDQLDAIEQQIEDLVQRDRANVPVGDLKNELAQLHGNVEKIQTQGVDAVILGANPPANADDIRQLRSSLVRRSDELAKRIQKIVANGTAPSPIVAPVAVGSPEVSAFSFVGGANGMPAMPSLQLPAQTAAPPQSSGFSFMQGTASPVSSPLGAGPPSSAFSFMAGGGSGVPSEQPPAPTSSSNAVFAGLSVRGSEPEPTPSAFGFLSGTANASTPGVAVAEPPRPTSPTAFSFIHGGAASPPSSPPSSGPPGSAFSFIS